MSTQIIPFLARSGIANNTINWTGDTFGVVIFAADAWSPLMTDSMIQDAIDAGAIEVGTRQTITGQFTSTDPSGYSIWSCDSVFYPDIAAATAFDVAVLFQDNGSDATNLIIAIFGLGAQTGDGSDVQLDPDTDEGIMIF